MSGTGRKSAPPVKSKDGKTLLTEEEQNKRWIEHFAEVLNQENPPSPPDFSQEPVQALEIDTGKFTIDEIRKAMSRQKNEKAPGEDEITEEMMKAAGEANLQWLQKMFDKIIDCDQVPDVWRRGSIYRLTKKGDLENCDNWRGVTLISVP